MTCTVHGQNSDSRRLEDPPILWDTVSPGRKRRETSRPSRRTHPPLAQMESRHISISESTPPMLRSAVRVLQSGRRERYMTCTVDGQISDSRRLEDPPILWDAVSAGLKRRETSRPSRRTHAPLAHMDMSRHGVLTILTITCQTIKIKINRCGASIARQYNQGKNRRGQSGPHTSHITDSCNLCIVSLSRTYPDQRDGPSFRSGIGVDRRERGSAGNGDA